MLLKVELQGWERQGAIRKLRVTDKGLGVLKSNFPDDQVLSIQQDHQCPWNCHVVTTGSLGPFTNWNSNQLYPKYSARIFQVVLT